VSCGAGVEDPGVGPLEGHLVQGSDEASLIPAAGLLLWRGRTVGELGGGEGGMGLRMGAEDAGAAPGRVRRRRAPLLLLRPARPGGVAVPGAGWRCGSPRPAPGLEAAAAAVAALSLLPVATAAAAVASLATGRGAATCGAGGRAAG